MPACACAPCFVPGGSCLSDATQQQLTRSPRTSPPPRPRAAGAMQRVASRLAATRLVLMDGAHIKARMALNVSKDDVALVVKDDARLTRLHQLM